MTGGFNTGFVEIRTLEGDKFLKNIRINEAVKTRRSYTLVNGLYVREMKPEESVYNIYYSAGKEGILNRVSGEQMVWTHEKNWFVPVKVKDLEMSDKLVIYDNKWGRIDRIEKVETLNRYFYKPDLKKNTSYYIDNVCVFG
jgi:hypothetical protein|nr:MAG TPA: hypothetical protein [Caudoviricetes sp.]